MQLLQSYIDGIINNALEEDIHYVDVTTDYLIPDGHTSKAYYIAKDEGVLCGIEIAKRVFELIGGGVLPAFAVGAAFGQHVGKRVLFIAVDRLHKQLAVFRLGRDDAFDAAFAKAVDRDRAAAGNADDIDVLAVQTVLRAQLVEAVRVTGLEEHGDFALFGALGDQVLGQIRAAERVPDEILFKVLGRGEHVGRHVVGELAATPAENAVYRTVREHLLSASDQFSLHRRSPNLRFSPSFVTSATKLFITSTKRWPSAAETHSTRVRSFSTPR